MDFTFLSQNTLLRRLFGIILLVALIPMIVIGVFSLIYYQTSVLADLAILMTILLIVIVFGSGFGAYIIARRITLPITQFKVCQDCGFGRQIIIC